METMGVLVLGATGNVGRHVVNALLEDDPHGSSPFHVVAATREVESDRAKALLRLPAADSSSSGLSLAEIDLTIPDEDVLAADLAGHSVVVVTLPQALSPADMVSCQETLAEAVSLCMERAEEYGGVMPLVVKLSSYGIDGQISQGPLGEAHRTGEEAFRKKGIPLVSVRPTSFFTNFEAYDWPSLRAGGRQISSPLGKEARVNWVACEDIGRVIASVVKKHLRGDARIEPQDKYRVVDVVGPSSNNLSAPDVCRIVGECLGTEGGDGDGGEVVTYHETALPIDAAYRGLWSFLRAGGFDVQDARAEDECRRLLGGQPLTEFRVFVECLVRDN